MSVVSKMVNGLRIDDNAIHVKDDGPELRLNRGHSGGLEWGFGESQESFALLRSDWSNREPRLSNQSHSAQFWIGFDRLESEAGFQGFERDQVHGGPIAFLGGGVGIELAIYFGNTDNLLVGDAMIEEDEVALLHRPQVIAGLKIANAGPLSPPFLNES